MLTADQRFQVRYYLGFPDLPALPATDTQIEEEIALLQRSTELEVRMTNLSTYAEAKVVGILTQLESNLVEMNLVSSRFPFKRIEDITFRDNEVDLRWESVSSLVSGLANILGITAARPLGPTVVGLMAV